MLNLNGPQPREETPQPSETLKQRAQLVIKNKSIDAGTRAVIRYGLETNDPSLGDLVQRVDAGETIIDNINLSQTSTPDDDSNEEKTEVEEKIEALAVILCRPGKRPRKKIRRPARPHVNASKRNGSQRTSKDRETDRLLTLCRIEPLRHGRRADRSIKR